MTMAGGGNKKWKSFGNRHHPADLAQGARSCFTWMTGMMMQVIMMNGGGGDDNYNASGCGIRAEMYIVAVNIPIDLPGVIGAVGDDVPTGAEFFYLHPTVVMFVPAVGYYPRVVRRLSNKDAVLVLVMTTIVKMIRSGRCMYVDNYFLWEHISSSFYLIIYFEQ